MRSDRRIISRLLVNTCRLALAVVFILSGFVKAVDPRGTQYKIEDYLGAMHLGGLLPDFATLTLSVGLASLEFCMGIFLLFAIRRRLTSRMVLAIMALMTPLTLWLALANPISDCGCFGDALVLTNWQTLWKNVVLLAMAIVVAWKPLEMFRFVSRTNQWIVINYSALFILAVAAWSLYDLPQFDFRPYHVGASIREGMEMPEGAEQPQFETTFILEKDGLQKEFTLDNYPDSTWTFVDSRTVQLTEGYVPPIHDFSLTTAAGDDITEEVLNDTSYTFLLVAPWLEKADDSRFDLINEVYEYSLEHGYGFYCLTSSTEEAQQLWRETTGAEYPICLTDPITLKTVIRSNPGLVLIKDGTVVRKWSHNSFPVIEQEEAQLPLERLDIGRLPGDTVAGKIIRLLMWFVLPLALLTLADRLWTWTGWLRRKRKEKRGKAEKETVSLTTNKEEKQ